MLADRYRRSIEHLGRAEQHIPLGSQTFTKSRLQLPVGAFPLYAEKAEGAFVWDIDGNRYIDLMSCLGAVILGHSDPDVRSAVDAQLNSGVLFSLPHRVEAEVAELLHALVPCAEQTRFAKNGTDVTTAAIRLSRAITSRDHVIMCGYHGWQDWSIGTTTMSNGVPTAVQSLTTAIPFNDFEALRGAFERLDGQIACLILEPMASVFPAEGFLEEVRALCTRHGTVLVFDEMLTGLRFAQGGAQEYFGVTPDLAAFGKAISNGFPLAALTGRADLMRHIPEIFFSGTHGGEALSLAAASVVLRKTIEGEVSAPICQIGQSLSDEVEARLSERAGKLLTFVGHPSWRFHKWALVSEEELPYAKTLLLQELARRGVLALGVHDVTLAHGATERSVIAQAYAEAMDVVADAAEASAWMEFLKCQPIRPLFQTRTS
jgi:glutamate-1-semialdehyde 2,1-aminomutase